MKLIKIVSTKQPNILEIVWAPNNVCNYKCEYCWPGSNEGNHHSPGNLDLIVHPVIARLGNLFSSNIKTSFFFK